MPARVAAKPPSSTLSSALRLSTTALAWKLRASPCAASRCGVGANGASWNVMLPPDGFTNPEMTFIAVVLPAPFGPTSPCSEPARTVRLRSVSARTPPKFTAMLVSARIGI